MLLNPVRFCPVCGAIVPNSHPVGEPYICPGCGIRLQNCRARNALVGWIETAAGTGLAWVLGFRYWAFLGAAAALSVGIIFLAVPITEKIWPTKLEPYKGGRIWG
jgi:hypothetical protein